jgi:UDP-N-acetylmuramate--alanine ligase
LSGFLDSLGGKIVHLAGVKGTGMSALAEILCASGISVAGSDVKERFYTDAILARLPLRLRESFSPENIENGTALVIHSAAYSRDTNPLLLEAARRGIPLMLYPEALGALSGDFDSSGISGVHGKTTTTAICGTMLKEARAPALVLAGSAVSNFGGGSTLDLGRRFFVAETCEYKRHFIHFKPRRIVVTSVEMDHQDYFKDEADIRSAFVEYGMNLAEGGELIYCMDDRGASAVAEEISRARPDLRLMPYGFTAVGPFRLSGYAAREGIAEFNLEAIPRPLKIRIPGRHIALDATAAAALATSILNADAGRDALSPLTVIEERSIERALELFRGSKRRSEILGEAGGVLFMDDYAHHPTAIEATLRGLREFHPGRKIILDFMSHTYSRTAALLGEFASAFGEADEVVLHKIYASARESSGGGVTGETLFQETAKRHPDVSYVEEPMDAFPLLLKRLKPGDLFITMGAGDNWRVGEELFRAMGGKEEA